MHPRRENVLYVLPSETLDVGVLDHLRANIVSLERIIQDGVVERADEQRQNKNRKSLGGGVPQFHLRLALSGGSGMRCHK